MIEFFQNADYWAISQVIFIDLVLAGDNAIVVGMAAATVAPEYRKKVIVLGVALAVIMRIAFAAVTMQLMEIIGLKLAGGLLLLWVCWRLYRDLAEHPPEVGAGLDADGKDVVHKSMSMAIFQVAVADITMSLDNVIAVAGVAQGDMTVMVIGLALSVVLMGVGATMIARLLQRHRWIGYLGLILIVYVALKLIFAGGSEIVAFTGY